MKYIEIQYIEIWYNPPRKKKTMKIQSTLWHWVSTYLVIVTHKSNNILQYQNRSPCYKIMCNFQNQQQHFHPHWKLTTSIPKGLPDFWVIRKKTSRSTKLLGICPKHIAKLVGGWTNPFWKIWLRNGSFRPVELKKKIFETTTQKISACISMSLRILGVASYTFTLNRWNLL